MFRRTLVFLSVASYLLAVSVGGWFHDHGAPRCASHAACSHSHDDCHEADEHSLAVVAEHDDCSICRFLAQKPIPTRSVETVESTPLAEEVAQVRPIRRTVRLSTSDLIRGPPYVA